jgi:hypothetical protein
MNSKFEIVSSQFKQLSDQMASLVNALKPEPVVATASESRSPKKNKSKPVQQQPAQDDELPFKQLYLEQLAVNKKLQESVEDLHNQLLAIRNSNTQDNFSAVVNNKKRSKLSTPTKQLNQRQQQNQQSYERSNKYQALPSETDPVEDVTDENGNEENRTPRSSKHTTRTKRAPSNNNSTPSRNVLKEINDEELRSRSSNNNNSSKNVGSHNRTANNRNAVQSESSNNSDDSQ